MHLFHTYRKEEEYYKDIQSATLAWWMAGPLSLTIKVCCKAYRACRSIDSGGNGLGAPSKKGRIAVGGTRRSFLEGPSCDIWPSLSYQSKQLALFANLFAGHFLILVEPILQYC